MYYTWLWCSSASNTSPSSSAHSRSSSALKYNSYRIWKGKNSSKLRSRGELVLNIVETWGTLGTPSSLGGGPSTVIETMFSPLSSTRPNTLFSSLSADLADFGFNFLQRKCFRVDHRDRVLDSHSMFFLLMSSLPELLAIAKDDIHVFVKGLELANEGTRVLEVELFSAKTMLKPNSKPGGSLSSCNWCGSPSCCSCQPPSCLFRYLQTLQSIIY